MVLVRLASRAVIATVDKASSVSKMIAELAKAGVRAVDVSLVARPDVLESTAAPRRGRGPLGAVGKGSDWLLDPRQLEKPGPGPLVGAGPLGTVLASSPSTSVVGALVMQGIPQRDALTLAGLLEAGKILLLCGVVDRTMGERVRAILDQNGAASVAYYSGRPYGTAFHGTGPGLR